MPECGIFGRSLSTGQAVPFAKPEWVVASSASCPWRNSFKLEHHFRPAYEQPEIVVPEANVHFFSDVMIGGSLVEWRVAGGTLHTRSMQADDVGVVAKGTPVWGRCFRPSEAIIISFNRHFLEMVARESFPGEIELKSRFHTSDLQIRALGILLDRETRAGCPTGRLYGESLGTALAAHVLRTYSVSPPRTVEYRGGLPRYELRHVMDYIVSNLAEDNSLQELADLVQMSPSHFCRSFKESTGRSPHQYILHLRVEEAKGLLRGTRLGIAEIAQRVGFSDQSHFTMIFRQVVGTTPAHWRGRELIGSFRRIRSTTKWQFSANNDTNSI